MNTNAIDRYIQKVIDDAFKAEERTNQNTQWQYRVIGSNMLFVIKCPYERVARKAVWRLLKNVPKNFGLGFHFVNDNATKVCYDAWNVSRFSLADEADPNFGIDAWTVFGKERVIQAFGMQRDSGLDYLNSLKEFGYDYMEDNVPWKTFEAAYKAVYGKTPMEDYLEQQGKNKNEEE